MLILGLHRTRIPIWMGMDLNWVQKKIDRLFWTCHSCEGLMWILLTKQFFLWGAKQELFFWFCWWGSSGASLLWSKCLWKRSIIQSGEVWSNRNVDFYRRLYRSTLAIYLLGMIRRRQCKFPQEMSKEILSRIISFNWGGKSGQPFYRLSPFLAAIVKHITLLQTKPYFFVHTCVLPTANTNV